MSEESTGRRARRIGGRLRSLIVGVVAALLVLVIFAGLAFLVFRDRMDPGPLLFFAGAIVGYLAAIGRARL